MKTVIYILLLIAYLFFVQAAKAEDIHFNNEIYNLKISKMSPVNKGYENEYYLTKETPHNWSKMIGIYYYPEISNPVKFANETDKQIEKQEDIALLKFIENKKQNKALLSYLQNGEANGKKFFTYNVFKYEKHPAKGMMVLRFAKKYFFTTNEGITKLAQEVKSINDDMLEQLIITSVPPIVEKDIP